MVNLLVILSFLFSYSASAAYNPGAGVGTITVGGLVLSTTNLKILKSGATSTTGSSVFYDATPGVTPGVYQVPSGKTFILRAVKFYQFAAAASTAGVQLGYSDNNLGLNSSGSLTNPIGLISGVAPNVADYIFSMSGTFGAAAGAMEAAVGGRAPTGKYINMGLGNSAYGSMILYGYEE